MKKIYRKAKIMGKTALMGLLGSLAISCSKDNREEYSKVLEQGNSKILYVTLENRSHGAISLEKRFFDSDGDLKTVEQYWSGNCFGLRGIYCDSLISNIYRNEMTQAQRDSLDAEYQSLVKYLQN